MQHTFYKGRQTKRKSKMKKELRNYFLKRRIYWISVYITKIKGTIHKLALEKKRSIVILWKCRLSHFFWESYPPRLILVTILSSSPSNSIFLFKNIFLVRRKDARWLFRDKGKKGGTAAVQCHLGLNDNICLPHLRSGKPMYATCSAQPASTRCCTFSSGKTMCCSQQLRL